MSSAFGRMMAQLALASAETNHRPIKKILANVLKWGAKGDITKHRHTQAPDHVCVCVCVCVCCACDAG